MEQKKLKTKFELLVTAAAVIAVVALVNYVSNRLFFRIDLTEDKQYTVADATRRALRGLDDIVTVRAFFSKDLPPEAHNIVSTTRDLLNEYKSISGGKLRVIWENVANDEDVNEAAQSLGVPRIPMQTFNKDKASVMMGYMGVAVTYADKFEALPVIQNLATLEYDLTRAIMRVTRDAQPKIGLLKARHADFIPEQILAQMNMARETTEQIYVPILESLKDDYEVVIVDVSEGKPIDAGIRTLIVPGGDVLSERAVFEIDQFFMNGGNLLVLADMVSMRQGQPQAGSGETEIHKLLEHYGVRVNRNVIMDISCSEVPIPVRVGPLTFNQPVAYPYFIVVSGDGFERANPAMSGQDMLMLAWASSLTDLTDSVGGGLITMTPLVSSSNESWERVAPFDFTPHTDPRMYNIPDESLMKPHTLAAHLSGSFKSYFEGKPVPSVRSNDEDEEDDDDNPMSQINLTANDKNRTVNPINPTGNLVVIGDADFITVYYASQPNVVFLQNLTDWLSQDNNLISIRSRTLRNRIIDSKKLGDGSGKANMIRLINLLLMPLLVAAAGIFISLKRREKVEAAQSNKDSLPDKNTSDNKENNDR